MFPHIKTLDDLLPHIRHNPQIRVKHESAGHIVVCYMLQDEDTFDEDHSSFLYARECRGITFRPDKSIAGRCLTKFFNVGERESTMPEKLNWLGVTRIMTKRDGSMVTPVLKTEGGVVILWKTKKSFTTKEAALASEVCESTNGGIAWVLKILKSGLTPTFEITSPKIPIVLIYEKDELTLLHVRENVSGRYLSEEELFALNSPFPIVENLKQKFISPGIPANIVSWDLLKRYAETETGVEGVVIQFGQEMVKLKTKWYCDLHRSIVFVRERDIAEAVLNDRFDDLLGAFALAGKNQQPIKAIAAKVKSKISTIEKSINDLHGFGIGKGLITKKDWALEFKDHKYFGLLMKKLDGREMCIHDWYSKHSLKDDFSLDVIAD